jgi:endonuclease YncB( thermonuclease family)
MSAYEEFREHPLAYPEMMEWRAYGVRAVDGDTIIVRCDQGFDATTHSVRVRLLGIDAPEIVGADAAEGKRSRARAAELVEGKPLLVITFRSGSGAFSSYRKSFERYLADVYYYDETGETRSLADTLIAEGLGEAR